MYDIGDDRRRTKVEKLLSSHGTRVNYSVFEVALPISKLSPLIKKLQNLTKKEDNVRIYFLTKEALERSIVLHHSEGIFDEELYF